MLTYIHSTTKKKKKKKEKKNVGHRYMRMGQPIDTLSLCFCWRVCHNMATLLYNAQLNQQGIQNSQSLSTFLLRDNIHAYHSASVTVVLYASKVKMIACHMMNLRLLAEEC